jgi:hypothetical protein
MSRRTLWRGNKNTQPCARWVFYLLFTATATSGILTITEALLLCIASKRAG